MTLLSAVCLLGMLGALAPGHALRAPARMPGVSERPAAQDAGAQREAEKEDQEEDSDEKDDELTLERLFPEKGYFGPSARSTAFSHDGRFCAFLYRPWLERRHGTDLYIYDAQTGQSRRITSVGRMAEYQEDTREVRDDREKKAKKAGVTLAQLAAEQAGRAGWHDGPPVGAWAGDATDKEGESGAVPPGPCELTLEPGAKGTLSGEIRVWLVRLPVTEGEFDRAARKLSAKVEDEKLGVKGTLSLSRDGDALAGELVLEEPSLTLALELSPKDAASGEEADEDAPPRGVIGAIGERLTLGEVVGPEDAEINDEKDGKRPEDPAPRYGGVQGFEWSPVATEMLLISGGDVYRLEIDPAKWDEPIERPAPEPAVDDAADESDEEGASGDEAAGDDANDDEDNGDEDESDDVEQNDDDSAGSDDDDADEADDEGAEEDGGERGAREEVRPVEPYRGALTRLTRTRERESDVQYVPDGSGYTYLRDGALLLVGFGDHRIVQLDPELEDGERMVGYRMSPDKKRLVFLANRGDNFWGAGRQVTIVNYRDRFARAEQVTRHMPDDPLPEAYSSVYLYDLRGHEQEEGTLERVFTKRISGPRDIMRVPEWSLDSSRVAFAAFEQKTGMIKILEAGFVAEEQEEKAAAEEGAEKPDAQAGDGVDGRREQQDEKEQEEQEEDEKEEDERQQQDQQDGDRDEQGQGGGRGRGAQAGRGQGAEEKPEFEIENATIVYEFFHFGGPNTPEMVQPQYLPDSRRMVFLAEISGYRQLHLLDPRYQRLRQLTEGQFEVYPFDISEDHERLFVTATREDPNQEQVYVVDTETGEMTRLSTDEGVYSSVAVSDDGTRVLANYVDFGAPGELVAIAPGEDATATVLTDSHPAEAHKLTTAKPEYFTYENRHGQVIHGHMFKPKDWTGQDERPLLIYVYGGPLGEAKMATRGSFNTSSYFFARYMTEAHGWVTATIDPRGASGYGAVFEKANFEQVGKPQTEDLVDGARWLVEHAGVDEERMSLHGWSFGGFQTQMVMYTEPDVFAAGIAGAGPTEWQNYNSWYSTGTIGPGEPGKTPLEKYSLLPLAKHLEGRLLLIHGMEDDNVLYQDTVRVYRELLKAGKEVNVELFLDPTGGHGLGGDVKTLGRFRKYEDFLLRYLGEGERHDEAGDAPGAEDGGRAENGDDSADGEADE